MNSKRRIFWKTIQEIAIRQLEDTGKTSTINRMLAVFPSKKKHSLPMHFAVSVPNIELQDIRALFADQPNSISIFTSIKLLSNLQEISVAPCHLAVMGNPPNMALIELLAMFDRNFGTLLASNGSTPLHFAAEYSNSLDLVQRLIQLNPLTLETYNDLDETPLICVAKNRSIEAPKLLRALIEAATPTVSLERDGNLPLHRFLAIVNYACVHINITKENVLVLLEAFPEAVNIPDADGQLPIHFAAKNLSVDILKMITEANPDNLTATNSTIESVAHCAAISGQLKNITYIHSLMPELFQTINNRHMTPMRFAVEEYSWQSCFAERVCPFQVIDLLSLVPETARSLEMHHNNLLHTVVEFAILIGPEHIDKDQLENFVRLLLRLIPGGALALNNQGQTPYDLLGPSITKLASVGRLLLLAGAPSLHPETRKQMNYQARKGALFAFFAGAFEPNIFYRIRDSGAGRVLMRQVVSFL